jgi:hypothetical protein
VKTWHLLINGISDSQYYIAVTTDHQKLNPKERNRFGLKGVSVSMRKKKLF